MAGVEPQGWAADSKGVQEGFGTRLQRRQPLLLLLLVGMMCCETA
jgi:hypothetical protein